MTINKSYIDIL